MAAGTRGGFMRLCRRPFFSARRFTGKGEGATQGGGASRGGGLEEAAAQDSTLNQQESSIYWREWKGGGCKLISSSADESAKSTR